MAINNAQLAAAGTGAFQTIMAGDPVDQIDKDRPFMAWALANKKESTFLAGVYNEKVRYSHDSNYQRYTGDDQVTYNRRKTVRAAPYLHYEVHDGFSLNETELTDNGITLTDDIDAVPTGDERSRIINLIKENTAVLKLGLQENLDIDFHLDGSQSPKAVPGLDAIVSTTPAVGVIGGIDRATAPYWRNNAAIGIATGTAGVLSATMETQWRACTTYGGSAPDAIFCGSKFYDAFRAEQIATQQREIIVTGKGGTSFDGGVNTLYFKGKMLVWDPTFDALDAQLGAIAVPWAKRCYFLSRQGFTLRPVKGRWMVDRTPARMYDRYVHYWGETCDFGITSARLNGQSVMSIA